MNSFFRNAQVPIPPKRGSERGRVKGWSPWYQSHRAASPVECCGQRLSGSVPRKQIDSGARGIPNQSAPQSDRYESEQMVLLGWSVSALAHGSILAVVAVVNLHATLIAAMPQKEPFRWEVSLMASPKDEPMVAQDVRPQETPVEAEADLETTADARPSPQVSEYSHRSEQSLLPDADAAGAVPRPSAPHPMSVSGQASVSAEQSVRTVAMAVTNPATSFLPPPQVESQYESSSLQVETQLESPTVLQRPQPLTRPLINRTALPDYGWLMEELRAKLERLKTYPISAKAAHAQGRVVVQVRIQADGRLLSPEIEESSGYPMLDQAALEALRAASPLRLEHGLGDGPVVMLVPLNYQLE